MYTMQTHLFLSNNYEIYSNSDFWNFYAHFLFGHRYLNLYTIERVLCGDKNQI